MASGYLSQGGGNRSGTDFGPSAGSSLPVALGGGGIGIGEADHVRWAWGGFEERPRDLARGVSAGAGKRRPQVTVKDPNDGGSPGRGGAGTGGADIHQGHTAGGSSGVASASLSIVQHQALTHSEVKNDLLDVLRMISSGSVSIQTEAPSMTRSMRTVQMEAGGASRSIALQCGINKEQSSVGTQVSESEVLGTMLEDPDSAVENMMHSGADKGGADGSGGGGSPGSGGGYGNSGSAGSGAPTRERNPYAASQGHSRHLPHSDVAADNYPTFLGEAKAQGLCNRYGFLSLPKPPFVLPPRRSVKTVDPATCTHLFAKHPIRLDDATNGRLNRTLQLWTQGSGFVPKF